MRRIRLTMAYDGTNYSGWQIQPNAPTIEGQLDRAIFELTGERVHVIGASRTDAGVHAMGNIAVFDTESRIPADRFSQALNGHLPEDVTVTMSSEVAPDFHPRHCDTIKTYEYRILNSRRMIPQFGRYSWQIPRKLDLQAMREAAAYLVGEHDFKSFCCVRTDVESTVRQVTGIEVFEEKHGLIDDGLFKSADYKRAREADPDYFDPTMLVIRVSGTGFLYNMVRIITGTLVAVGRHSIKPSDVKTMLEACDRTSAKETAPAQGLTLMNIAYLDELDDKDSDDT